MPISKANAVALKPLWLAGFFSLAARRLDLAARASLAVALLFAAIGAQAKIGVQYQMLLGNPSNATATTTETTNYLVERPQYSFSYNDTTRQANWVSWNFTMDDRGGAERKDNFIADPLLPSGYNAVQGTGYSGSGYDRGHMCPSADRTVTQADNDATFYMTNMVPQAPDNNQGVWATFENKTREIAAEGGGNEMLIICGPSLFPGTQIASGVKIPGYVWKIVLVVPVGTDPTVPAVDRINASTRVIAIKIPNVQGVRSDPWQNYVTSIAQIEADTGLTFLTNLPPATANALRVKIDGQVVTGAPAITTQPAAQTVAVGGTATFAVAATGNATLSYQWFKGEDAIEGATASTLTVSNVAAGSVGFYSVVVTNGVGSATSNNAELIVTGLTPVITTTPAAQTNAAGSTAIFTVAVTGTSPFTYEWRKDSAPITGNPSAATATLTIPNVQMSDIGLYDVRVANDVGNVTSAQVTLAVNPAAPTISAQPASRSVGLTGTATLSVTASGTAPLSYQWRKNGATIPDNASATTATLVLNGVQNSDQASYDVIVTNSIGVAASSAATLTVSQTADGVIYYSGGTYTQDFDSLPSAGTFSLTGLSQPFQLDSAPISAANMGGWSFGLVSGTARFTVGTGSGNTGSMYSYGDAASHPATDRALGTLASNTNVSRFAVTLVNSTDQTIVSVSISFMNEQWRRGDGTVANKLSGSYAIGGSEVTVNAGTYTNSLAMDITSPVITGVSRLLDGNAPANRLPASATLTGLAWAPGQRLVLRWTDANDAGADDAISMDDFSFAAQLVGPTIDTQPAAQSAVSGGTATFAVVASGPGTLRYQWRKGTTEIVGNPTATTSLLSLTGLQPSDAGGYNVVVTNAGGSVISADATLAVESNFSSWQAENFTSEEIANPAVSGPNAVYGQDGLANLVKYALGLDPKVDVTNGLPEVSTTTTDWVYTYTRPSDRDDLTYTVERSTDLANWVTTSVTHEFVSSSDGIETWRARVPLATGERMFFRLQVTSP